MMMIIIINEKTHFLYWWVIISVLRYTLRQLQFRLKSRFFTEFFTMPLMTSLWCM